jgi:hypothetical protein
MWTIQCHKQISIINAIFGLQIVRTYNDGVRFWKNQPVTNAYYDEFQLSFQAKGGKSTEAWDNRSLDSCVSLIRLLTYLEREARC